MTNAIETLVEVFGAVWAALSDLFAAADRGDKAEAERQAQLIVMLAMRETAVRKAKKKP